ncbi:MAG: flippase [Anaerolinea sp.]|nr:flippase [Anaerolinea sp.]
MIEHILDRFRQAKALMVRSPFARNVTSTFTVQILSLLLATVNAAVIARVLGPSGKGILALTVLAPNIFALFLSGGISVANVYYIGQKRFDLPTLSANATAFTVMATGLGVAIAAVLYTTGLMEKLLPGVPPGLLALSMLGLPFSLLNSYFISLLQGRQLISQINLVSLMQRGSTVVLSLLTVALLGWGLTGAVLAVLASSVLSVAVLGVMLRRLGARFWPRWNRLVIKTTLKFGLRGYVANVLQFFNYRLDLFLVNYFLGPSSTGIYTVAVAMAEMLWYLPNAVGFVIFPKSANTKAETMNRFTPRVFRLTMALTAAGAVAMAIFGKPFIDIVYSPAFASAYGPMLALLPGVVLLGGGKVLTNEIAGRGYPQYNSIASGVSLVLTIGLDLLLIPRLGVLGAAVASSVAYIAIFILALVFYRSVVNRQRKMLRQTSA